MYIYTYICHQSAEVSSLLSADSLHAFLSTRTVVAFDDRKSRESPGVLRESNMEGPVFEPKEPTASPRSPPDPKT